MLILDDGQVDGAPAVIIAKAKRPRTAPVRCRRTSSPRRELERGRLVCNPATGPPC